MALGRFVAFALVLVPLGSGVRWRWHQAGKSSDSGKVAGCPAFFRFCLVSGLDDARSPQIGAGDGQGQDEGRGQQRGAEQSHRKSLNSQDVGPTGPESGRAYIFY